MGYKDPAAKFKYNNEFNKKAYDHIHLTVPKGQKEAIQEYAQAQGESVNAFIYRAVLAAMGQTTEQAQESPDT